MDIRVNKDGRTLVGFQTVMPQFGNLQITRMNTDGTFVEQDTSHETHYTAMYFDKDTLALVKQVNKVEREGEWYEMSVVSISEENGVYCSYKMVGKVYLFRYLLWVGIECLNK